MNRWKNALNWCLIVCLALVLIRASLPRGIVGTARLLLGMERWTPPAGPFWAAYVQTETETQVYSGAETVQALLNAIEQGAGPGKLRQTGQTDLSLHLMRADNDWELFSVGEDTLIEYRWNKEPLALGENAVFDDRWYEETAAYGLDRSPLDAFLAMTLPSVIMGSDGIPHPSRAGLQAIEAAWISSPDRTADFVPVPKERWDELLAGLIEALSAGEQERRSAILLPYLELRLEYSDYCLTYRYEERARQTGRSLYLLDCTDGSFRVDIHTRGLDVVPALHARIPALP